MQRKFSASGGKTILYVKLDSFFPSVETSLNPQLKNKPVLVTDGYSKYNKVISPNFQAQQIGISQQMQIENAIKLLPEAVMVQGSLPKYQMFSKEFYKILSSYSDNIEPVSLDEAYIDMSGFDGRWISPEHLANDIHNKIYQELEITSTIGIATNKICAYAATKSSSPNSIFYVAWGQEKFFLKNKPLAYLPTIGPRTEKFLKQVGIMNIGDFAKQPLNLIVKSFGENGKFLWQLANGIDNRKLNSPTHQKSISKSISFSFGTNDLDYLNNEIFNLIDQVWNKLNSSNKQSNTVGIKITNQNGNIKTKQKKLYSPFTSKKDLFQITQKQLIALLNHNTSVVNLGITLYNLTAVNNRNNVFETSFFKLKEIQNSLVKISNQFNLKSDQVLATT
ncbi:MAG: hypothetical protein Q8P20_10995 [bacterium]|nr:hypothetical protein [bacterium]